MKHWYLFDQHACYGEYYLREEAMLRAKKLTERGAKGIEIRYMTEDDYREYCQTGVRPSETKSGQ